MRRGTTVASRRRDISVTHVSRKLTKQRKGDFPKVEPKTLMKYMGRPRGRRPRGHCTDGRQSREWPCWKREAECTLRAARDHQARFAAHARTVANILERC